MSDVWDFSFNGHRCLNLSSFAACNNSPLSRTNFSILVTFLLLWLSTMTRKQLVDERVYFGLQFQRDKKETIEAGEAWKQERKAERSHLPWQTWSRQSKLEVGQDYTLSMPVPGDVILPAKLHDNLCHKLPNQHHQLLILVSNICTYGGPFSFKPLYYIRRNTVNIYFVFISC